MLAYYNTIVKLSQTILEAYNRHMKDFLTRLSKARFPYEPLISIELSKANLVHNLGEFQKMSPNNQVAPVLKSNAYGHGLIEIARALRDESPNNIPFFVVDSYFEAIALRANRVKTPLLVIGYTAPETIARAKLNATSFTISSIESLRLLNKLEEPDWMSSFSQGKIGFGIPFFPRPHRIHLKIDTGMRRQGLLPEEISEAMDIFKNNSMLILEGICSHLSDADNDDDSFTEEQVCIWNKIVKSFKKEFPSLKYWHLSNTDGHRYSTDIDANVSRLGIGLYGLADGYAFKPRLDLKPVLEMRTVTTSVKKLRAGETVGYGNTFKAMKDMVIATIPVGYYEGLDRRLSSAPSNKSRGFVLVGPNRSPCPIIGRVSMNITSIDVSDIVDPQIGMEIVVISQNTQDANSISNIAKTCGTITYEVVVKIPAHLKRVVV